MIDTLMDALAGILLFMKLTDNDKKIFLERLIPLWRFVPEIVPPEIDGIVRDKDNPDKWDWWDGEPDHPSIDWFFLDPLGGHRFVQEVMEWEPIPYTPKEHNKIEAIMASGHKILSMDRYLQSAKHTFMWTALGMLVAWLADEYDILIVGDSYSDDEAFENGRFGWCAMRAFTVGSCKYIKETMGSPSYMEAAVRAAEYVLAKEIEAWNQKQSRSTETETPSSQEFEQ